MTLHENEIPADETLVRSLLAEQRPEWAALPLSAAGAGTDNTMYRLGDELLVRLPRTAGNGRAVRKEQEWLPRLAPLLGVAVPEPVHAGTPAAGFPLPWSVYRWIDGAEAGPDTVRDWAAFGADLAEAVRELHRADLMGATRSEASDLSWYRGGPLAPCDEWVGPSLEDCRALVGDEFDVDVLEGMWRAGLALPEASGPQGWLHGDLKPTNLLVRDGRLHAVIDFGGLSIGRPDAEHATVWDLPAAARHAYRDALGLDEATWIRARAWAVAVAASGISYYRDSFPAFVAECRARLRNILDDAAGRTAIAPHN
ncbi:aminoglycoside phosphotransferase family protein [Streptomyces sp. NPDC048604]|uniref:aminoglycoside phosphotransferase family protein n=1 Tax=Streptomyces sp. NPDC048604 TaxID=3365578 RepID=UPI00371D22C5